jgi:2-C-methyl-D-erythritol 4-phosphate cytidylyltransferase
VKKYIIIVAGGSGSRMGSATPKQFLELQGLPILMHTLNNFHQAVPEGELILALPEKEQHSWQSLCEKHHFQLPHQIVNGGESRFYSVQNALQKVHQKGIVAIHDGVRPFISNRLITDCLLSAQEQGAAIPTIPVQDSIRQLKGTTSVIADRSQFVLVQTPQCFLSEIILKAYEQEFQNSFTDDASVVEQMGFSIHLVEGDKKNIKITTPSDLKLAEALS